MVHGHIGPADAGGRGRRKRVEDDNELREYLRVARLQ